MSEYIIRTTNMPEHVRETIIEWCEGGEEIVRCKDCRMFGDCEWNYENEPMGFCAWGERREGE